MSQEVVEADRCDVVAERLQGHAVVARRELELLEGDAFVGGSDARFRADAAGQVAHVVTTLPCARAIVDRWGVDAKGQARRLAPSASRRSTTQVKGWWACHGVSCTAVREVTTVKPSPSAAVSPFAS